MTEETQDPAIDDSLNTIIDFATKKLCVCMPGKIVSYDNGTQFAKVQPLFQQVSLDENDNEVVQNRPVINNVPVIFPQSNDFFISFPVKPDDICLLFFADRSMDGYKGGTGKAPVDPKDNRAHSLNDAIALVGFGTKGTTITNTSDSDMVIAAKAGNVEAHLTTGGEFQVKGSAARFGTLTAAKALALAEKVDSKVSELQGAINSHLHLGNLGAPTTAATPPIVFAPIDNSSTRVFADG